MRTTTPTLYRPNDHCNAAEAIHVSFVAVCSRNLMYYVVDPDDRCAIAAERVAGRTGVLGSGSESDVAAAGPSQL